MFSCQWLWLYAGAFLMFAELLVPGFVLFFFGLSAVSVGLCRFVFADAFTMTWQLGALSFFSIVYLALLRRWMKNLFSGSTAMSDMRFGNENVGRIGKVVTAIEPPKCGRVLLGDSEWDATSDAPVAAGADVEVVSQENLTLHVRIA